MTLHTIPGGKAPPLSDGPDWRCRVAWHSWGPWTEVSSGTTVVAEAFVVSIEVQRRACRRCGRAQLRVVKAA